MIIATHKHANTLSIRQIFRRSEYYFRFTSKRINSKPPICAEASQYEISDLTVRPPEAFNFIQPDHLTGECNVNNRFKRNPSPLDRDRYIHLAAANHHALKKSNNFHHRELLKRRSVHTEGLCPHTAHRNFKVTGQRVPPGDYASAKQKPRVAKPPSVLNPPLEAETSTIVLSNQHPRNGYSGVKSQRLLPPFCNLFHSAESLAPCTRDKIVRKPG